MNSKSKFTGEVFDWLSSMNFDWMLKRTDKDHFDLIEIWKNDRLVLLLRLIDLETWLNRGNLLVSEIDDFKDKQTLLRSTGIASVTLWEDIWFNKKEIVQSRLNAITGISERIPGRVTQARKLDKPTAKDFLDKNHLQGSVNSKIRYGLFLPKRYFRVLSTGYQLDSGIEELLVAVATFSHPRTFERNGGLYRSYELIRFANLRNTTVVGGFDKLLRAFTDEYKPGDIMTYADLEWSDGASYSRLGFDEISDKDPVQFWLDPTLNVRYTDNRRPENDKLIEVYNAGSRKFVKTIH
ncbi:hypothetical protein [Dyadobacter sp. CY356]|uniref:hypothetical protein n=1 Tax=Dyadobacter sp. CY356 TaxID=2906442 RepID=UPI001F30FB4D|nr:hypothetical protein [Dyadobacter sp. CY356]MCF0055401.1 hypothetical protein [Dyadobacter sp. CY356]